jgi:WhiB family transcriptional regulator, redox-sensing transcriptional regulator
MATVYGRYAAYGLASDTADDWREQGACRDEDADLFYPLGGDQGHHRTGINLAQERAAKAVCLRCPVRLACRTWAWGVWGGLNENERRALRAPKPVTGRNFGAANAVRRAS